MEQRIFWKLSVKYLWKNVTGKRKNNLKTKHTLFGGVLFLCNFLNDTFMIQN